MFPRSKHTTGAIIIVALFALSSTAADARWFRRARPQQTAPSNRRDPLATQQWKVGQGPPRATILFLHGLGCGPDGQLIKRLVGAFNQLPGGASYKVVAPWLRPVRKNSRGTIVSAGCHTMSDQLQRARQVLRGENRPVVLLGHSFGGKAALQLAREFPDKVSCVVGLAPSVNMLYSYWKNLTGERGLPDDAQRICRKLDRYQNRLRDQLATARRSGDRDAIANAKEQLDYHTTMKDLVQFNEPRVERGIRTPTLVLQGTEDRAVSVHYARRFADRARNPGVQLTELQGLDHHFLKYKASALLPTVDRRATERVTQQMAARISGFIDQHQHRQQPTRD
jgi:pimeloyl-ACP methyl ester carboxylesterase